VSLNLRLFLNLLLLMVAMVLLAGVGVWGLRGLDRGLDAALAEYGRLRRVYEVGREVGRALDTARRGIGHRDSGGAQGLDQARRRIVAADVKLAGFSQNRAGGGRSGAQLTAARGRLRAALGHLEAGDRGRARQAIGEALGRVAALAGMTRRRIEAIEAEAARHRQRATMVMGGTVAVTLGVVGVAGVRLYRAVVAPLRRLERSVGRIAAGRFEERVAAHGDREFARLATEFNRMASELESAYRDLEAKVRAQGRELAEAERLASVGFLAAGVAHEINNPLSVIAGEAELALRRMEGGEGAGREAGMEAGGEAGGEAGAEAGAALEAVREEAFRCKAITEKLLGLARRGEHPAEAVPLRPLAEEVVRLARALPPGRGRTLRVVMGEPVVQAERLQLRQVLLNLVVNGLEATAPERGEVVIEAAAERGRVRLAVSDNGRGMDTATRDRVFEPFFTLKRGRGEPGTGLGLSISHAIARRLGGRLEAWSDGPGRGSRFVLELAEAVELAGGAEGQGGRAHACS